MPHLHARVLEAELLLEFFADSRDVVDERLHAGQQAVRFLEVDVIRAVGALPTPALRLRLLHRDPGQPQQRGKGKGAQI